MFEHCSRVIWEATAINPELKFMLENVVIKLALQQDEVRQEELMQMQAMLVDALDLGAPHDQTGNRRVFTNICEREDLEEKKPVDPNIFLNRLGSCLGARRVQGIVAAGSNAEFPVKIMDVNTGLERSECLDELEALQGQRPRQSCAFGEVRMEYEEQEAIIGNGFNYQLVRGIFAEMSPMKEKVLFDNALFPVAAGSEDYNVWPGEEKELFDLSWKELLEDLKKRLRDDLHQPRSTVIQHQLWLSEWLGKRKAAESEMPQRMEVPQRSEAGGAGDPHH